LLLLLLLVLVLLSLLLLLLLLSVIAVIAAVVAAAAAAAANGLLVTTRRAISLFRSNEYIPILHPLRSVNQSVKQSSSHSVSQSVSQASTTTTKPCLRRFCCPGARSHALPLLPSTTKRPRSAPTYRRTGIRAVAFAMLCCAVLCGAVLCCAVLCCGVLSCPLLSHGDILAEDKDNHGPAFPSCALRLGFSLDSSLWR